jgi:hypothetical protein
MLKKSLKWGAIALLAAVLVFVGCENSIGISEDDLDDAIEKAGQDYQKVDDPTPFITTDPGLGTLDSALAYISKWVWYYKDAGRAHPPYYLTLTPTRFSFSSAFAGIPKGAYPYTLTKDGDGYVLKIADWSSSTPGAALKPIAKIVYDPEQLTMVFTNASDDDDYWDVDGDTFLPDLTEYYAATGFVSSSYVYIENNVPATGANKIANISFVSGNLATTDASEVFTNTAVNNKPGGIVWWVIGKERKFIASTSYVDMGTITLDPEKPIITLGDKKFAQRLALCGFICTYYAVDCCPYINGNWVAVDDLNADLIDSRKAYITIQAGAGWLKIKKASSDDDTVDPDVYGAGLAGLVFGSGNVSAYGISVTDDLTIYAPESNLPLLKFNNLEDVDSQKPGNTSSLPNPRIITLTPAKAGASVIRLKKL